MITNSRISRAVHSLLIAERSRATAGRPGGRVPDAEEHPDQPLAGLVARPGQRLRAPARAGSIGEFMRPGTACPWCRSSGAPAPDRPRPRSAMARIEALVEAVLGERRPGGVQDGLPGVLVARAPPAASYHDAPPSAAVRRPSGVGARPATSATTAAPATIARSRHIVAGRRRRARRPRPAPPPRRSAACTSLTACSQPAICSRGTNSPHSSSCGTTTTGMNCTAWNSVRAKALQNRPSATPSTALTTAIRTTSPALPAVSRPSSQYAAPAATAACTAAASPNAMP